MTIKILTETFNILGTNGYGETVGTVQIDMGRGHIVTAKAYRGVHDINVAGFIGRYRTSNKPWIAHVHGDNEGVSGWFGRDDRSGRFQKMSGISWEPSTYERLWNAKVWNTVEG